MIVCYSNPQAQLIHDWFCKNSKLNTRLVTDDVPSAINRESQLDFRKASNGIDLLIVNLMLTTGYDVPRLKKMYLLRAPKEHALLQTISRVNRPYKNPEGKVYQYGYISDFVDITEEYDRTVASYLKELNEELADPDDPNTVEGGKLVFDVNAIEEKYQKALTKLEDIQDHDNLEEFNSFLNRINFKDPLYTLRRLINTILDCKTEFLLSREEEKADRIDKKHFKRLSVLVQRRIDFLNLSGNPVQTMDFLSEKEVVNLMFEFIKLRTVTLDMKNIKAPDSIKTKIERLTREVKNLQNHDDDRVVKLDEFLRGLFEKLQFNDVDGYNAIDGEIQAALEKARAINEENARLSAEFGGQFAYVKTYQDFCTNHPDFNQDDVILFMKIVEKAVSGISSINSLVLVGRTNFIANVKKNSTSELLTAGLYKKLNLSTTFDAVLGNLFVNLQLF